MQVSRGRVIVTGATRGIGRAVVDSVVGSGGRVVAIARDEEALAALAASHPERVRPLPADIGRSDALVDVAEAAVAAFGGVEGLVNCAGVACYEPVGAITVAAFDTQLRVNLVAPMILSQTVAEHMRAHGGSIVNVSSTLSERAAPFTSAYAATKAGLNALTRGLALELAPHSIRVNAVLPGGVDTDMLRAPRVRPGESLDRAQLDERVRSHLVSLASFSPAWPSGSTQGNRQRDRRRARPALANRESDHDRWWPFSEVGLKRGALSHTLRRACPETRRSSSMLKRSNAASDELQWRFWKRHRGSRG